MQLPTDDNDILGPVILLCPGPRKSSAATAMLRNGINALSIRVLERRVKCWQWNILILYEYNVLMNVQYLIL